MSRALCECWVFGCVGIRSRTGSTFPMSVFTCFQCFISIPSSFHLSMIISHSWLSWMYHLLAVVNYRCYSFFEYIAFHAAANSNSLRRSSFQVLIPNINSYATAQFFFRSVYHRCTHNTLSHFQQFVWFPPVSIFQCFKKQSTNGDATITDSTSQKTQHTRTIHINR